MGDKAEGVRGTSGHAIWTSTMSTFMLVHLSNLVASGMKTTNGFKKVFLNGCARAVNEKFNTSLTGDQVKNHLKTWQKKWTKIIKLKKLSAALFNEDSYMITLDDEHYNGHVKPIMHYKEMDAIFGNMATGNFAKDSSAALGRTDEADSQDDEEEVTGIGIGLSDGHTTQGAASSTTRPSAAARPNKKAKVIDIEQEGLVSVFKSVGENIVEAIKSAGKPENEVPFDLFAIPNTFLGFESMHVSAYYLHLCSNPVIARSFCNLPYENQLHWFTMFICDKFPGHFPHAM